MTPGRRTQARKATLPRWLERLQQHPLAVLVVFVAALLGGIAAFVTNVKDTVETVHGIAEHPSIIAFGLSPASSHYRESQERIADGSDVRIRSFEPVPPFDEKIFPVLLVSVDNPKDTDLIITAITYVVERLDEVKGGVGGPLTPLARYQHSLQYKVGRQRFATLPPFRVPANSAESLEVELASATPEHGKVWTMRLELETNLGRITSGHFQIQLPPIGEARRADPLAPPDTTPGKPPRASGILDLHARDDLFRATGVLPYLRDLDELDRDVFLIRARSHPFDTFSQYSTATNPPVKYAQLMPPDRLRLLWTNAQRLPLQE